MKIIHKHTRTVLNAKIRNGVKAKPEIPTWVTDTVLTATDFLNAYERGLIHNVAPGEGKKPLSIFRDKYSEELAYPGIFLGQKRPEDKERSVKVFYSDICKSE